MKTARVNRLCDPARLHAELEAADLPVVTVRGVHAREGEPAQSCVVVLDLDDLSVSLLEKLTSRVSQHVETRPPSQIIPAKQLNDSLSAFEQP